MLEISIDLHLKSSLDIYERLRMQSVKTADLQEYVFISPDKKAIYFISVYKICAFQNIYHFEIHFHILFLPPSLEEHKKW